MANTKASADKPAAEAAAKSVTYIGGSTKRVIDGSSWSNVGVANQEEVTWDRGGVVKADKLNAAAIKWLDKQKDFKVNK